MYRNIDKTRVLTPTIKHIMVSVDEISIIIIIMKSFSFSMMMVKYFRHSILLWCFPKNKSWKYMIIYTWKSIRFYTHTHTHPFLWFCRLRMCLMFYYVYYYYYFLLPLILWKEKNFSWQLLLCVYLVMFIGKMITFSEISLDLLWWFISCWSPSPGENLWIESRYLWRDTKF